MSEAHDRKSKKIGDRGWKDLCELWPDYIPNISVAGTPPEDLLTNLPGLGAELAKIPNDQLDEFGDIAGVRSGILHESIYLLHKAVHVLGSSLIHASTGMCTWSLSSGYHSAFFAVKAVSGLLGVSIVEFQNKTFLVDAWGMPRNLRKKKWPQILLVRMDRAEQRHVWGTFQRLLDKTDGLNGACPDWLRRVLKNSNFRDFGRQRNNLHYHNNVWYHSDLHKCQKQGGFASARVAEISLEQPDFSIQLACGLVRMGSRLLADLAEASSSRVLRLESALIDQWLDEPFNAAYHQMVPAKGNAAISGAPGH